MLQIDIIFYLFIFFVFSFFYSVFGRLILTICGTSQQRLTLLKDYPKLRPFMSVENTFLCEVGFADVYTQV